jgi:hypothetical protein
LPTIESNPPQESAGAIVSYFTSRAFEKALQLAFLSGGQAQKRSDKARIVLGSLQDTDHL